MEIVSNTTERQNRSSYEQGSSDWSTELLIRRTLFGKPREM